MKVKVIKKTDEFLQISEVWKKKYEENESNSFFQSFEWNYHWYLNNLYSEGLFIILFYKEDYLNECSLICPTYIDEKGRLRFISDIHSDFCDTLVSNLSDTDSNEITNLFKELICNNSDIRKIHFMNFSDKNSDISILLKNFNSYYSKSIPTAFFNLEKEKEFPYSAKHFKSSNRKRINKNIKRFLDYESQLINVNILKFPKEDILRLRDYMVRSGIRKLDFFNDKMINAVNELYDKELVDINMVSHEGEVKSIIVIFKNHNSYQLWVSLFMDIPHISVFTINSFLKLLNEDVRIDLGRGLYSFKVMNYAPNVKWLNEFFFSKNKLDYIIFIIKMHLKSIVKGIIKLKF